MKNTELNLIPIFVAIYEESNLTKAANRMDISQPAVSKALAKLRDIYDDPLFHRTASGVEPTPFASDIYPALAAALKNYTSTLSASRGFNPKKSKRIFSIASVSPASFNLIPNVMKLISAVAPDIFLEVHLLFTEDYESDLRLQRYDLIIDMTPKGRTSLKYERLYNEYLQVVCSQDHPRIGDTIDIKEFLNEEHVVVSRWHTRRSLLEVGDFDELHNRRVVYRAAGAVEMLPVIQETEYIGILPEATIEEFSSKYNVKGIPLPFELPDVGLCMIWHPSRTNESGHRWLRNKFRKAAKMRKNRDS
ncbi:LysR family transcriptional regulator [Vibrio sp. E150_011]